MKNQNKTFRNFSSKTTKKLNILRDLYKLENTAMAIDLITENFFKQNENEIKEKLKQRENELFNKAV